MLAKSSKRSLSTLIELYENKGIRFAFKRLNRWSDRGLLNQKELKKFVDSMIVHIIVSEKGKKVFNEVCASDSQD